jgi:hypothetical protein
MFQGTNAPSTVVEDEDVAINTNCTLYVWLVLAFFVVGIYDT